MESQTPQSLQAPAAGHAEAASPAGIGQTDNSGFGIGAFNTLGVSQMKASTMTPAQVTAQTQQSASPQGQSAAGQEGTTVATRQLTEKDERHFTTFVTKATQEKYDFAKLAVEADADAIYKIAETDKDLATRLMKEFDFGAENVDDLLQKKNIQKADNPIEAQKQLEDQKWKQNMENQLLDEKILRLKGEHENIDGDVESKLRELMIDQGMKDYTDIQKIEVARTLAGKSNPHSSADNVALAVLQREEGIVSSPRGTTTADGAKQVSPEMKKMLQAANLTEKDLALLPPNIDDMISSMYGPIVGK